MAKPFSKSTSSAGKSRREVLASAVRLSALAAFSGKVCPATETPPDKLGVVGVTTIYGRNSHADVIFGKILEGYNQQGGVGPRLKLLALHVEQTPPKDLSRELARKYNIPVCKSIGEAVQLGFEDPSMAGVLSVGEHGSYPVTHDTHQKTYPRRRFFDEIVAAFDRAGRVVPVFNDKHLAYNWKDAQHMYNTAQKRQMPLMAGSSLPVAWRQPALSLPIGCEIEDALVVGYGGFESYGFHALEALQCMVERRKGGEVGVESVQAVTGEEIWKAHQDGRWSRELLAAALNAQSVKNTDDVKDRLAKDAPFYLIRYRDGLMATVAMANRVARQFSFAAKLKHQAEPAACLFALQEERPYGHFAWLLHAIERMVHTGKTAYPVERTLLTTGILDRVMHSLADDNRAYETPELQISYKPVDWPYAGSEVGVPPSARQSTPAD
jgi:hypothetical protein